MTISSLSFAQTKTETFNVSGNCGMCKTKIEKAAKDAGASAASWDVDAKQLTVTYKSSTTNAAKIQQKVAEVGYDNAGFKATAEAYNKLHGCCKYERETAAASENHSCSGKCDMKDGKCADMTDGKKWIVLRMASAPNMCMKDKLVKNGLLQRRKMQYARS